MSSSTESRIISMKFVSDQFTKGVTAAISHMDKLKAALDVGKMVAGLPLVQRAFTKFGIKNPFATAQKGVTDLQASANQFNTNQMTGSVNGVSKSFIAMATIAITALSNIVNKAVDAGLAFAKSFTVGPILDGLREYETNLKSIQTVQANTDRPLPEIERALEQLNKYSDQTIYNFSEMAKNVGTFTAAGVDLETSVSSIKGIANLAALSGSSSQQAATAMYQLSQAISSGRVGLQDWNSVVNAGMGGKKLQNALAQTAIAMGDIDSAAVKMVGPMQKLTINGGSFRESIMAKPGETSWLTSDILVNTLATMDGRFSNAALKAEKTAEGLQKYDKATREAMISQARLSLEQKNGVKYTDEQFKALQKMSTMAFKSATEVKTLGQVFDIAKETIASGWSASFKNIFGSLNEAKKLFTDMSRGLNDIINDNALARNIVLNAWKEGGGRDTLITGLTSAWEAFASVIGTVQGAFRDVFPAKTGEDLIAMSERFAEFTASLVPGKDTLEDLGRTFRGVFSIFSIAGQVLGAIAAQVGRLFSAITAGSGSFLNFTGGIGDYLVALDQMLKKSNIITSFFEMLGNIIAIPLTLLAKLGGVIANLFDGFDPSAAGALSDGFGKATDRLSPLAAAGERLRSVFAGLGDFFSNVGQRIGEAFSGVGDAIAGAITADSFGKALDVINTALLGGIVLMLKNFMSGGVSVDVGGGLFSSIKDTLDSVTGALTNMQTSIKSDILMKIAAALAILTASIVVLSLIDPKKLASALTGMAIGFAGLQIALVSLSSAVNLIGVVKLVPLTSAILTLAAAMLLLSLSVKIMASMDFGDMLRGLVGIGVLLFMLSKAVVPLSKNSAGMAQVGVAFVLIGLGLNIMAAAVRKFSEFSWGEMAKGLVGIASSLAILAGAMRIMPRGMLAQAAALVVLGVALRVIATAVQSFANLGWDAMVKGFVGMAGALLLIAGAMHLMPKGLLVQAAALLVLSGALKVIGSVITTFGGMSIEAIAKGLGTLAGGLAILVIALKLMSGTLAAAVTMVIVAGALSVLAAVLVTLGAMSWDAIIRGLSALAGIFLVIGAAGILLGPLIPVLLGLGAALVVLGAGLLLVGAAALTFATAFSIIAVAGSAGVAVMAAILRNIIKAIPGALKAFGQGIVQFAQAIAKGAPAFYRAFGAVINSMLRAATQAIPKLGRLFTTMLNTALRIVVTAAPKIANAGLKLIVGFLAAISRHVPKIINIAADIIVKFLNGIARNIGKIIQSGVNLIIKFVNGVAKAIDNNSEELGRAGGRLAVAMVNGLANGIRGGAGIIRDAALNAARDAWNAVRDFFKVGSPSKLLRDDLGRWLPIGMAMGIDDEADTVSRSATEMARGALNAMTETMRGVSHALDVSDHLQPTISPILDLSQVTREAGKLGTILTSQPLVAGVSLGQAESISSDQMAAFQAAVEELTEAQPREIKYEQNIYSPKAISHVEAYRNTRNLLSIKKEELQTS